MCNNENELRIDFLHVIANKKNKKNNFKHVIVRFLRMTINEMN
jgi:hypothetical protein